MKYLISALAAALIGTAGFAWMLLGDIEDLTVDNAALNLALSAAKESNINVKEDQKSDAEIDNTTDDDLRNVPERWLLPAPGSGGLY